MSHAVQCQTVLKDLAAIREACLKLGWEFKEGQRTYVWYGSWVDDSPVPEGMFRPEEMARVRALPKEERKALMTEAMGKCDHAIRVPGANYEVGLVKQEDGTFRLRWDWFESALKQRMGGQGGGTFVQRYNMEVARREALKKGYKISETHQQNGAVRWLMVKG